MINPAHRLTASGRVRFSNRLLCQLPPWNVAKTGSRRRLPSAVTTSKRAYSYSWQDGSDPPPFEFSPKTPLRRSQVGKEVANNPFRQLRQLSAGKHIVSLPSIGICNKVSHPKIGWLSWYHAYFCTGPSMWPGNHRAAPAGKTEDSNLKTSKLKCLHITKEPASGHFHAELLE
jgi:hypothetical protein